MTRFNPSNMFGGLRGRFDPLTTKIATRKKDIRLFIVNDGSDGAHYDFIFLYDKAILTASLGPGWHRFVNTEETITSGTK